MIRTKQSERPSPKDPKDARRRSGTPDSVPLRGASYLFVPFAFLWFALRAASGKKPKWGSAMRGAALRVGLPVLLLLGLGVPASATAQEAFDPDHALDRARYLAESIGDRPAGSRGEQEAAGWLAARFAELGYSVRVQPFAFSTEGQQRTGMNVIATRPGQAGYGIIYAGAHYDTVKRIPGFDYGGPGANDNASGVGVLLEAARIMAAETVTPTLTFVAFGAEELGLTGSRYYVSTLPAWEWAQSDSMVNFDCVGIGDDLILYVDREKDKVLAAALPVAPEAIERLAGGASDQASFAEAGIPAVLFSMEREGTGPCGPNYHRATDTFDTLERAAIERAGQAAVDALRYLVTSAAPRETHLAFLPYVIAQPATTLAADGGRIPR